jgi:hypothetical protein
MVRDFSAEHHSMLHEPPADLAARFKRNRIWMDTFGGDHGMAALTNANQSGGGEEEEEEAKVSEVVVVQKETDTIEEKGPYPEDQYPPAP